VGNALVQMVVCGGWGGVGDKNVKLRRTASLVSSAMMLLATHQQSGNTMAPNPRIRF